MEVITPTNARKNLYGIIKHVVADSQPVEIASTKEEESVIMIRVLLQSSKMNNTSLTLAIVYAGIPNNIFISVQTENPKRVPSFRFFLYNPRMASMPLIVVEAVRKLR